MLIRLSAPPLKRSMNWIISLLLTRLFSCSLLIPGIGTCVMNRYSASIARVNRILPRRSGRLKASIAACISLGKRPPPWVSADIIYPKAPPPFPGPPLSSLGLSA